jgi:hypothetical protein
MHPQLALIDRELAAATARANMIVRQLDEARFHARPRDAAWSVAECIVHLNLTSQGYLPLFDEAIAEGANSRPAEAPRYRRDFRGWLLAWSLEPPAKVKTRTIPAFTPKEAGSREDVMSTFERLQGELSRRLESASGLDLNRLRIRSPFNGKLWYNVFAAFGIIASHERRHLWQAELTAAAVSRDVAGERLYAG